MIPMERLTILKMQKQKKNKKNKTKTKTRTKLMMEIVSTTFENVKKKKTSTEHMMHQ